MVYRLLVLELLPAKSGFPDSRNRLRRRKACTPFLGGAKHAGLAVRGTALLVCFSQRCYFVCLLRVFGSIDFLSAKQWIFQQLLFITLPFPRCLWSEDYSTHNPFSVALRLSVFSNGRRRERVGNLGWPGLDTRRRTVYGHLMWHVEGHFLCFKN